MVFTVIIGTVILQSLSARPLARLLGVAEPDPTGVLVVGSNPVALAIAKELQDNGQSVLVADSHWASIQEARMLGLPTFYGSAVSAYADDHLDLTGIGTLLSLSRQPSLNELACVRFADDFGRDHVFTISNQRLGEHDKHRVSGASRGRVLFSGNISLEMLQERVARGDDLKTTRLSEEFDFENYRKQHPSSLPVLATDESGHVHFPVVDNAFDPKPGWSVIAMVKQ